jgi:hypothetical protein
MTGNSYLADTNAFIYLLQKHPTVEALLDAQWKYSFITEIELLGKPGIKAAEISTVRKLLDTAYRVNHSQVISEAAISFRQQYALKIPNAIIAATAMVERIPLLTADIGFVRIRALDIVLIEL